MVEGGLIKDEYVGEGRDDEVYGCARGPGMFISTVLQYIEVLKYQVTTRSVSACLYMLSRDHWLMYATSAGTKEIN